jgi:hypothetical protein
LCMQIQKGGRSFVVHLIQLLAIAKTEGKAVFLGVAKYSYAHYVSVIKGARFRAVFSRIPSFTNHTVSFESFVEEVILLFKTELLIRFDLDDFLLSDGLDLRDFSGYLSPKYLCAFKTYPYFATLK